MKPSEPSTREGPPGSRADLPADPARAYGGEPVLVTGATGFIGAALCRRLLAAGARVTGVARRVPPASLPGWEWKAGDLADSAFTESLFETVRPAHVFHLAGHVVGARGLEQVAPTFRGILQATVHVLQAAARRGRPRVTAAGSMEEPDPAQGSVVPSSPYAAAKAACDGYAAMFHALYGLPVVRARIFMVYGPGPRDSAKLVPYVIRSLLRGEAPELTGGGRKVDWIFVDDVVDGLLALGAAAGIEGGRFDLGTGVLTSVRDLVRELARRIAPEIRPRFGARADRLMEQVRKADVAATARACGWTPRTPLRDGLRATVEAYRVMLGTGAGA